ncbi:transposon Tf2-6 polyprotein [Trichonephila clavipes]|nr:transposon Tf2-6 polyprotein [Trichonephila clavipes]
MSQIEALPVTSKELRQETGKDIEPGPLLKALREGKDLQGREAKYTIEDGCIMYGQRVCISRKFRSNVLEELPARHLEIAKMKAIARSMPWERIHVDFAGPIFEHTFFLIVDAHSKWLHPIKVTTTKKTIECLRDSFARFGLPRDKLRRDNFEFRDRKFDVGDRVAVRVYRAANTRWKFGTIVNQDGVHHYIIDVQGTLQRFEKTTLIFSMPKWRKIGSSSVQGVPSTDVAVPDLSQSSAKETDSETRTRPVPDRPFY